MNIFIMIPSDVNVRLVYVNYMYVWTYMTAIYDKNK